MLLYFFHDCCVLTLCLKFYLYIDINICFKHELLLHTSYTFYILMMEYCVEYILSSHCNLQLVSYNLFKISAI